MNIKNNQKGIGLLEMIVAISIFVIVLLITTNIFENIVGGQRKIIAAQNIQESLRYVFAVFSREIRMAQKADNDSCITSGEIYQNNVSEDDLKFINQNGDCVHYYLNNNTLMIDRGGNIASTTPRQIKISDLKFRVIDNVGNQQSLVNFKMKAVDKNNINQAIIMQSSISARYYGD